VATLQIPTARVYQPLLEPKRYKGAHGGRGSGKSHFFAGLMVETAKINSGFRGVCIREVQKSLKDSAKKLIEDKIAEHNLGGDFDIQHGEIKTPGNGVIIFQGMQDHTAESIKSLEGFDVAWAEEAQSLSARSLTLLRPTIRKDGSELWFSWNRSRKNDAVDQFLTGYNKADGQYVPPPPPDQGTVVKANWRDNPWFPSVLEQERQSDLANRPELYDHIWEGDYAKVTEGAYYARDLIRAREEGRIGRVSADPLLPIRLFMDLGGQGARADAFAIWAMQFVGQAILVLDYYEAVGQPLGAHLNWMRSRKYTPDRAEVWLPHDGGSGGAVTYETAFREANYFVTIVPNQGKGAAKLRVEAGRRRFPAMWFNEATTEPGRAALGNYHEKIDDIRQVGLGPEHDWSSHGADAFGLGAVAYEMPLVAEEDDDRDMASRSANPWTGY
jgi:phage terminase large subunit